MEGGTKNLTSRVGGGLVMVIETGQFQVAKEFFKFRVNSGVTYFSWGWLEVN